MADTENLKDRLEKARSSHQREIERIGNLLKAISEAEQYLDTTSGRVETQSSLILTPDPSINRINNSKRIREAVDRMPDTFTSHDLYETANVDGGPYIDKRRSFAPFFTKLKKKGIVIEVQPNMGNIPGIYKKK